MTHRIIITAKGKAISDIGMYAASSSIIQLFFIAGHCLACYVHNSVANVYVQGLNATGRFHEQQDTCVHTSNFHAEKLHKYGRGSSEHGIKHITSLKFEKKGIIIPE